MSERCPCGGANYLVKTVISAPTSCAPFGPHGMYSEDWPLCFPCKVEELEAEVERLSGLLAAR